MNKKYNPINSIIAFIFGQTFFWMGIYVIINHLLKFEKKSIFYGFSDLGGGYLIIIGVLFTSTAYYLLPPFSRIRQFFENRQSLRKRK